MGAALRGVAAGNIADAVSWDALQAILVLVAGALLVRLLAGVIARSFLRGLRDQSRLAARKSITYIGIGLLLVITLDHLGVELRALLGAAGVIGIAVGIASQASLSNVISGLFLVSEKTFEIGDVISLGGRTGIVHSIDPLSIKLRTFDNLLVRIPNQQIIDSELINVTRFPIRRMDFDIAVPATQPVAQVETLLRRAASSVELCLDEPEPLVLYKGFREGNIDILFGVWFEKANFVRAKNRLLEEMQGLFKQEGVRLGEPVVRLSEHSAERAALGKGLLK